MTCQRPTCSSACQVTTWWQDHMALAAKFILSEDQKTRWAGWFNSSASHMHTFTSLQYAKTPIIQSVPGSLLKLQSHQQYAYKQEDWTNWMCCRDDDSQHCEDMRASFHSYRNKNKYTHEENQTNNIPQHCLCSSMMRTLINANVILFTLR